MLRKGDEPIPGYRLEEFLGRGQFGEVWRTTAPGGTSAALKFIDLSGTHGLKEFRGIQRVKEIRHAHLMPITALWMLDSDGNILGDQALQAYDTQPTGRDTLAPHIVDPSDEPGWLIVAMLLGDKNLLDRLEERQKDNEWGIAVNELLDYMEEAAKGIDFLNTPQHDLGEGLVAIQHCDIKPANIMLVGDSVAICDFGLARMLGDATATATGMVGSPAYMAPECINRKPSHATDQYSLAITYVELRTGELPFKEESYIAILDSHRNGSLELSRLEPREREVIEKATSLNPEDRYPSCVDMVRALRQAFQEPIVSSRRRPVGLLAILVVGAMVLGGIVGWKYLPGRNDSNGTRRETVERDSQPKDFTLTIVPSTSGLTVDGNEYPLDAQGQTVIQLAPDQSIDIAVRSSDDYLPEQRTYTLEDLQKVEFKIVLPRSARYFADQAFASLSSGDTAGAVQQYKQALLLDESYATPQPTPLRQHEAEVLDLAISGGPTSWLVSASVDGTACAWRLSTGQIPADPLVLRGHGNESVVCLAIGPEGRWLVTGGWDNRACIWDLAADDPEASCVVLAGHEEDLVDVQLVPPRQWVVTASFDSTICLWDLKQASSGEPFARLKGHSCQIEHLVVSPDYRALVSIDADSEARRWDLTAAAPESSAVTMPEFENRVQSCLATPDSQWIVTGDEVGNIQFSSLVGEPSRWELPSIGDSVDSLAFDQQSRRLAIGAANGAVQVVRLNEDLVPAAPPLNLDRHVEPVAGMAITPDGRWLLTAGYDKLLYLWDLESTDPSAAPLRLPGHLAPIYVVAVSQDGKWAASGDDRGVILLWNLPVCQMIQKAAAELDVPTAPRIDA